MSGDCDNVVQAGDDIVVSADCAQGGGDINVSVVSGGVGPAGPAGQGVPTGGTTGQVLAKTSGANYATGWVDQTGGSGGAAFVTVGRSGAQFNCTGTLGSPTDHTTIQAAIAAVQAAGGGTVFVKSGVYFLSSTVNITAANVQLIGEGRGTELRAVGNYGHVLSCALTTPPTSWPGLSGLVIESIRFESTVERTSGAAIYAQRTHNAVIRDVYLADLTYGVAYGITTPVPPAFYDGIVLDGQDQCLIDNIVGCAVNRGIHIEGWASASADFSYDGMISNCKLWGSPGTKRGTAISVGPNLGGTVLDFNSVNQWEYSVYAVATGFAGGIITIRGGYAENDEHGYHLLGWQNVLVSDLWSSLHVIDCIRTVVKAAANPNAGNCSIEVELGDPNEPHPVTGMTSPYDCECLIYGNADVSTTSGFGGIITVRKFDANSVAFSDDARLTNAREWTAATISQAEAEAGTATTRRAWTAERVKQAIAAQRPGVPTYLQQTTPPGSGWVWFQTNGSGDVVDIITG
jgi:hypothetical protein